jgi:predicted house-cleaning noncanonical NTP pyrophosphatase (MazG superfamily)
MRDKIVEMCRKIFIGKRVEDDELLNKLSKGLQEHKDIKELLNQVLTEMLVSKYEAIVNIAGLHIDAEYKCLRRELDQLFSLSEIINRVIEVKDK